MPNKVNLFDLGAAGDLERWGEMLDFSEEALMENCPQTFRSFIPEERKIVLHEV
jgi:hypothetical protein